MNEPESYNAIIQGDEPSAKNVNEKRVALVGRFGGMSRKEAGNVIRSYGGEIVELGSDNLHWVVIGADEPPLAETDLLSSSVRESAARGELEVLNESELWQRLGLVDCEEIARQYYSPAMLAHLLGVSIRVIRRWHRRGLIRPVHCVHKLPYFDFEQVATARRLAGWIASGANPKTIEERLVDLIGVLPNIARPLDQLSILVEGKEILLRQDGGLLDLGGQLRFDFDAAGKPEPESSTESEQPSVLKFPDADRIVVDDELLQLAYEAEDSDDLETAVDYYHAILARDGPRADISFQIGELLYRIGHVFAARERFYVATELDADFVEARASLGDVLAETSQYQLAVAAYRGALSLHPEYSEVHLRLARTYEQMGMKNEATEHWLEFLRQAPNSPWAEEATQKLIDAGEY